MWSAYAHTSSSVIRSSARETGWESNSHFMRRVKRRNVVLFHSCTHIPLITWQSCYHLMKENMKMTCKVGDSWCYRRLHIVCIWYVIHSLDSMLSLDLCQITSTQQQTKLRALLCFQQTRSCGWNGFLALLQRLITQLYSSADLHNSRGSQ